MPSSAAAALELPATADEWLAARAAELDRRLRDFAQRLRRSELDGVEFRDGRLHIAPVKAIAPPESRAFADRIEALMPRVRITELLHDVNRATGFASAFTNLRTGEHCDDDNRQFFRSAKRGDAAGEINARYGHDPGLGFHTHVSDQHGPYSVRVMSATSHDRRMHRSVCA